MLVVTCKLDTHIPVIKMFNSNFQIVKAGDAEKGFVLFAGTFACIGMLPARRRSL